jgi:hypothetical protein
MGLYGSKDQHPKLAGSSSENDYLASIQWQYCEKCGNKHLKEYKKCPACGYPHRKKMGVVGKVWICLAAVVALILFGAYSMVDITDTDYTPRNTYTADKTRSASYFSANAATTSAKTSVKMTTGQKNALRSAKSYLSSMNFSYKGLIHQLEFEQYTHEEAVFAADNCGADWYDQAVKSARDYLELFAFSKEGLISQLEYEGFTRDQAEYGAKMNGYE